MKRNRYRTKHKKSFAVTIRRIKIFLAACAGMAMLFLVSLMLLISYDFLTQSELFSANSIDVTGNRRLSRAEVLDVSGIHPKQNILSINLSLARKKLLTNPWIAEASVRRDLPDRILIEIKEHTPMAVLDLGRKLIINTKGEIIKEMEEKDPQNLPVIKGLTYTDLSLFGSRREKSYLSALEILKLAGRDSGLGSIGRVSTITIDRQMGIRIVTKTPKRELFLGFGDYRLKMEKLDFILSSIKKKGVIPDCSRIDLMNPERIVIKPITREKADPAQKEV